MQSDYWFLDRAAYTPLLESLGVTQEAYLNAMREVVRLFPTAKSREYYQRMLAELGSLDHFNLVPAPNQRLRYHPVPILLNVAPNTHVLSELLYLGMALYDTYHTIGQTRAFQDITLDNNYRGALFEIEVAAALVRSGLEFTYSTKSPDFIIPDLSLGIEATTREVPLDRAIAERLLSALASLDFRHLSVVLLPQSSSVNLYELADEIVGDVYGAMKVGQVDLSKSHYRVRIDLSERVETEKTITISYGKYQYEESLSHLVKTLLIEKETKIQRQFPNRADMTFVVALDVRSLLPLSLKPESEYEQAMAARHQAYYDRLRAFEQAVMASCQTFSANSQLIAGVLLWERRRAQTLAEQVHRPYSISLITAAQSIRIENLADELTGILRRS